MKIHKAIQVKTILLYIITATIITLFYPSKVKFKYEYSVGRPWHYELLTAPFDFQILKTPSQLQIEKDSATRSMIPYFTFDESVYEKQKKKLAQSTSKESQILRGEYTRHLLQTLEVVYARGVVSSKDYQTIQASANGECFIMNDRNKIARKVIYEELYTITSAYEYVINSVPRGLNKDVIRSANINEYIEANLLLDELTTEKVLRTKLAGISPVMGSVQAGERIVNKGDVVTDQIFQELESLKKEYESKLGTTRERFMVRIGQFLLTLIILSSLFFFLLSFRVEVISQIKNTFFFLGVILWYALLTELSVSSGIVNIYIIPYAMVPILVRVFIDSRTAFVVHMISILIASLMAPFQMEFILLQFIAGMVAIVTLKNLSQRSDLIRCTFMVLVAMLVTYVAFSLFQDGNFRGISLATILNLAINFIFLMFTYVLVYLFERLFGYVSNISLVELSDINSPLLRELSEVTPGTFQHSLQVSILASEAASKINADVRLVRAGALYHDIGKMKNPTYFTENQGLENPHDKLPYDESAKMIIRHVTDGVEMAERAGLPKVIIDFIRTHHGLGRVKYFYTKFVNENPDVIVDESIFRYPGPNPFTKETGILMLADAVEASSRSLKDLTEQKISTHIHKIVDSIVDEGLLKSCPLTFRDVEIIKTVFLEKLKTMYHSRISYPELKRRPNHGGNEPEVNNNITQPREGEKSQKRSE
ncbi:HD family phosphohydrolase [Porphyromonas sp.]|uniref:HD family phosphohydrolase n=1 Tax=Porphyromonas sp. TaxID=1924944 RepID=UPI0026DC4951|nr:HDIG domain-containing metalloprotein [Porphyromonas sp.]MDO4695247.1 HDIG domain-containing protein [Porphyromonas sp.]MDO4771064.1 HDIG domain-containing protein [Porphyromonas sp.]